MNTITIIRVGEVERAFTDQAEASIARMVLAEFGLASDEREIKMHGAPPKLKGKPGRKPGRKKRDAELPKAEDVRGILNATSDGRHQIHCAKLDTNAAADAVCTCGADDA